MEVLQHFPVALFVLFHLPFFFEEFYDCGDRFREPEKFGLAPAQDIRAALDKSQLIQVPVKYGTRLVEIPWTYAYFEIAERPLTKNPLTGQMERFEGFLGGQATNLFDMTKMKQ